MNPVTMGNAKPSNVTNITASEAIDAVTESPKSRRSGSTERRRGRGRRHSRPRERDQGHQPEEAGFDDLAEVLVVERDVRARFVDGHITPGNGRCRSLARRVGNEATYPSTTS